MDAKETIRQGKAVLGIELGSTRKHMRLKYRAVFTIEIQGIVFQK